MLNYDFTAEELEAMSVKYCDHLGFNYLKLLVDIEPEFTPNEVAFQSASTAVC